MRIPDTIFVEGRDLVQRAGRAVAEDDATFDWHAVQAFAGRLETKLELMERREPESTDLPLLRSLRGDVSFVLRQAMTAPSGVRQLGLGAAPVSTERWRHAARVGLY